MKIIFEFKLFPLFIIRLVGIKGVVTFGIWLHTLFFLSLKQKLPFPPQSKSIPFGHGLLQSIFSK